MDITVVKGNPTEDEIAALSAVLAQLQEEAMSGTRRSGERNLWGTPSAPLHYAPVFNPGAFSNVSYF